MILGMGLLLFIEKDGELLFFVIEELMDKPAIAKKQGMKSFPLETHKPGDESEYGTIQRLVVEEIGITPELIEFKGISPQKFQLIPGRPDIFTGYGYARFIGDPGHVFCPQDTDIRFVGWQKMEALLAGFVRVEVPAILAHFQQNYIKEVL